MSDGIIPLRSDSVFRLSTFFSGHVLATGIFEDRFGTLRRRFEVDMHGTHQGGAFVLTEDFRYDDGERERRVWTVREAADGTFSATAADIVGTCVGQSRSDAIHMNYGFRLRVAGKAYVVQFDDRIYRTGANTAFNRASVRKWGIKIGEVSIFFQRQNHASALAANEAMLTAAE